MNDDEKKLINSLLVKVGEGDEQSLILLYKTVAQRLFSIVMGLLGNRQDAEDAVSETFVRIVKYAAGFKRNDNGYGWMATIARNCAVDILNSRHDFADIDDVFGLAAQSADVDADIDLAAAMNSLEPQEREIVLLRYYGDITVRDIAKKIGLPKSTVMYKLKQAEDKLRKIFVS